MSWDSILWFIACRCIVIIVVFWSLVFVAYYVFTAGFNLMEFLSYFKADELEDINWEKEIKDEIDRFKTDLTNDEDAAGNKKDALKQSGLAENKTNTKLDEEGVCSGDLWLCDARPALFALIQFVVVYVLSVIGCFIVSGVAGEQAVRIFAWPVCIVVFVLFTSLLAVLSYMTVDQNERLGVKRFGKQLNGYFSPGLQFRIPQIERVQVVPLKNLVWAPHDLREEKPGNTYYINGTSGSNNVEPGKFRLPLIGRWEVEVQVQVTMRIEKQWKTSWHKVINEYRDPIEIGQQIAAIVGAVITRRVREVPFEIGRRSGNGSTEQDVNVFDFLVAFNELQNKIPEVSEQIMIALIKTRSRLPLTFMSVIVTGPIPGEEFKQLLQQQDEAEMRKLVQLKEGEAVMERSRKFVDFIKQAKEQGVDIGNFLDLNAQEVQRAFSQLGENQSIVDALMRIFAGRKSKDIAGNGE